MERKKWVILLTNLFGAVGGIPAFNRQWVEAMEGLAHERGWPLQILVLNDSDQAPASSKAYAYRGFAGNRWRFVRESLRAARGADTVIFGHVHFSPLVLAMPRAHRWLIAHGIEVWGSLSWLCGLGLRRMDRILCVSRFTRDRLMERHHVKAEKMVLFPNTAPVTRSEISGRPTPLESKATKVVFTVSRLWPEERYKKIDRVIEAMPAVLASVPDAVYVIVGEGGDRPRLERLARDAGVQDHVVFKGALPDNQVKAWYERCDVFILPSLGEGFGIVFLEAMACGKPCVGADAGAIPEVIQDGQTGLLVKPDSFESISKALIRLLKDEKLCQDLGEAGRQRFYAEYAVDRFRERLSRMMEQPL